MLALAVVLVCMCICVMVGGVCRLAIVVDVVAVVVVSVV